MVLDSVITLKNIRSLPTDQVLLSDSLFFVSAIYYGQAFDYGLSEIEAQFKFLGIPLGGQASAYQATSLQQVRKGVLAFKMLPTARLDTTKQIESIAKAASAIEKSSSIDDFGVLNNSKPSIIQVLKKQGFSIPTEKPLPKR